MDRTANDILRCLAEVEAQRQLRAADPLLAQRVEAVKRYQQRRFSHSYADLLEHPRYQYAARFFLEELYGPGDFSRRDAQFARVVPSLARLFPKEVVRTVAHLAQLHALSERLDGRMAQLVGEGDVDASGYVSAWQSCGAAADRQRQIDLTITIGEALEAYTRKPLLRQALRLMRAPAVAAGLQELQRFLESGFDVFREMRGAETFLLTVRQREEALARALFACPPGSPACPAGDGPLGQLP